MISVLAIVIGPDECDLDPVTTEGSILTHSNLETRGGE